MARRLTLQDPLRLRTTSVYRTPRDLAVLPIAYGDFTASRIPCLPLDQDGLLYHCSDRPMQLMTRVYVDGSPQGSGYRAFPAYQDETGQAIAAVQFDNPQYEQRVAVSGRGAVDVETGNLIENPADLLKDLFVRVQGYAPSSLDLAVLARFGAECRTAEILVACLLEEARPIREFLDELARNCHAQWLVSDGRCVMRLRWR